MAGTSGWVYRSGPQQFRTRASTASTGLTTGDDLSTSSGKLALGATGTQTTGVSMQTKSSSDATTTALQFLQVITGRTRFLGYEKRASGSLAATNEGGLVETAGLTGARGFDSSATSNGDIFLETVVAAGAANVGSALVAFADPSWKFPAS